MLRAGARRQLVVTILSRRRLGNTSTEWLWEASVPAWLCRFGHLIDLGIYLTSNFDGRLFIFLGKRDLSDKGYETVS